MKQEITFLPSGRTVSVRPGTSVLDAARRAGVPIATRCGGQAACLMCKFTMQEGSGLTPMSEIERRKLAGLEKEGVRLACQAKISGRAVAILPEDPLKAAVRKQLMRQEEDDKLW